MTVHARRLARQCRERLAAQKAVVVLKNQPEQQHAAIVESARGNATKAPAR